MSEGETHSTRSKSNTNLSKLISQYSEKQNNNHRSSVNLTMDDINSDKFTPDVSMENNDFLLPEDLITVELVPRSIRGNFIRELVFRPTPPFLSMFYDEYSRHFLTINVGKNLPSQLELIKYGPNNHSQYRANHANNNYNKIDDGYCIGSNILNHYCPGYSAWYSSFRTLPEDNRHFLSPEAYTDTNLVVKVNKCLAKRPFEPLFGSIAIYAVVNDELSRISESFYFDATPESVRKQYPLAYGFADVANASQKYLSVSGSCINVGDGTGSNNHMNMFNIRISDDMKGRELYVIVQLSKILSIETEKALLPYTKNILPEIPKHIEACNRLINYRQPVGFGISRLGEKSGKFSTAGNKYINIPLYAQRSCISEAQFHSIIKELLPSDGSSPYSRSESLDIDMKITIYDLGKDDQVMESLSALGLAILNPVNNTKIAPQFLPSHIPSIDAPLLYSTDFTNLDPYKSNVSKLTIRKVKPIMPLRVLNADIHRELKRSVDNTLFIYPLQLERCPQRNLSIKVEVVEFLAGVEPKKLEFKVPATTVPHAYLNNIYNNCITGPHFCSVTYTRVSYHNKAPSMNDEIKIRLPDILTGRHWVKFTLQHIHVKQPVAKQSILSSLIRTNNDKTEADIIDIGVAMLPLMANNAAILEDGDHLIQFQLGGERNRDSDVSASSGTEYIPTLKVRTRAYTSFVSSDPLVENSFKMQPMPLGYLPSSIMTRTTAQSLRDHGEQYAPNEAKFVNSAKDLIKASPLEVVRHFLVLMRQMQRAMVAGTGIYDESYINPFKHFNGRCQAFLTMLQLFGKLAPDMSVPSSSASHYSKEKDFLKAYVDFVFDEEVPIDGDDAAPLSPSKTIFTASRFSSDAEQNEITSPNRVPNHSQSAKQFRAESLIPDEDNERMSLRPLSTPVVYGSHKDSFAKSTLRPIARSSDSKDADVSERVERLRSESPRIPSVSVEPTQSYIDAPDEELSSNNSSRRASGTCEEIVEDPKAAYSRLLKERMHRRKSGDSVVKFANTDGPVNEVDTSTSIPSDNKNDRLISSSPEMISLILQNKLEQSSGFDRVGSLRSATNDSALDFGVSLAGSVDLSEASEAHISADTEREYIPELESVSSSLSDNVEEEESARNENDPLSWVSSIDYSESDAESKNKGCSDDEVDNEAGKRSSYYRRQLSHISEASVGSVAIDDTNLEEVDEGLKDDSNNDLRSVHISSSMEGIDNLNSRDVPHQSVCEDQFEDNDEFDQVENAEVIVEAGMELSMDQDEKMQNMFDQGIAASAESFQSEESRIDRDSWGSFVTDSRWSTNNLTSVKHALDGTNSAGKKYVEDIALHVVLQAERIILERQFNVAILAISAEILCNSDHFSGDDRFLSESQIMAGKRFRTNRELLQMPFEDEKSWFSSIDTGKTVNEMDIIVGRSDDDNDQAIDRSSKDSDEVELPKNIQESHITNRKSIRVVLEGTKEIAPPASGDALLIQPSLPLFDTILGYRDRVSAITSFQNKHWWPWMYEVLVFQWGAVLAITLSSSSLISTANLDSIVGSYPFEYDLTHSGTAHMRSGWKDTRNLLMDHGPVLLKMIYKSLVLRIKRERKITPVLLDDQFLNALDNLIMLIALEMATFSSGLWLSRILNKAVAAFLKAMFAVASSNQVLRLIRSYFRALRGKHRVDETELRLQMMEELAQFDYSVALNFPLVLDAPFSVFGHNAVNPEYSVNKILFKSYTSYGIRGSTNPPPYLFAHLLVSEIMATYRQEERKTKDVALEILRDMIVRHVYDARYQDQNSQQRVACMYLPLIKEVLKECNKLEKIRHDATERKELLALLLYVLQGIPEHLLRNRLRILCAQTFAVREDLTGYPISSDARPASVMHYEPESERKSSVMPRVVSMRHSNDGRMPSRLSFFRKHVEEVNHVRNLIITMHLILDTFEFPNYSSNTSSTSVEASLVLAPSITVNHLDDTRLDDPNTSQFSSVRRNPSGAGDGTPKWSLATNRLASLDHRMQTRKMTASTTRKSLPQNKGEERKWISHVQRMHTRKEFEVSTQSVSRTTMIYASRQLCYASTISVIEVLLVMIEEVPKIIVNTPLTRQSANTYTLRDTNIDESILTGILDIRIIDFIRMCSSVILHALYCHQEDPAIVKLLSLAKIIVKRFGAKIFLGAVEDSLQDWMRSVLYHCASQYKVVRNSASNFLLFLLRSSFNYLGSLTLIVNTVLAIMNDVIEGILDANKAVVKTHADEDRIVGYLNISIVNMKDAVRRNSFNSSMHVAFAQAVVTFMNSLEVILLANSDIRRYVSHPVGYDFLGANLLDGPFNERTSLLVQTLRQRRKEVQRDAADSNKSGFQIEEVMMHFVRAAEVYDPIKLPRFRMQWLENLARLHELRQNRAEGAEIRWKIFQLCQLVEHTWHNQWSPRPPLEWIRRTVDSNYYQNHSVVSASMSTAAGVNRRRSDGTDFSTKTTTSSSSPADTDSGRFSTKILPDRNFYAVMAAALDGRPHRSWFDQTQYLQHMETSLSVATERFCAISLVNLAERSSFHLIRLYRLSRKTESMAAEYARISNAVKTMIERGITTNMAIGKFYRVSYEGAGVPENLRTKEFIFRNATHLHVSEFQTLVVNHLKSVVEEGVVVKTVQDISSVKNAMEDANIAYIVMNSVKPIMKHNKLLTRAYHRSNNDYLTQHNYSSHEQDVDMEGMNRVSSFQYSVPFTSDPKRSHAKKIDDQWMRSTILTVKEPFPYIITRQEVYRRDNRDYSPIEVAINDIEERIETMESELEKEIRNPSDCNDLMRIIQGTVMPQVNAGAAEVAKVFLDPTRMVGHMLHTLNAQSQDFGDQLKVDRDSVGDKQEVLDTSQIKFLQAKSVGGTIANSGDMNMIALMQEEKKYQELCAKLKVTLLDFLNYSKLLLAKTKRTFSLDENNNHTTTPELTSSPITNRRDSMNSSVHTSNPKLTNTNGTTAPINMSEMNNYIIWQTEMEKGYQALVKAIHPYLKDLNEADALFDGVKSTSSMM